MAEILENKNELMEQREQTMSDAERNRLIGEYTKCIDDALREADMDTVNYYKEKLAPLKEARDAQRQEYWKEYWENKRKEIIQESQERQQRMTQDNIKRRTPNYGTPTTEEGWAREAANEFKQRGESWYYNVCMTEAAKCHVDEALDRK